MSQEPTAPPIETPCPNPACARVHRVKAKYAGARGKCPACRSWMYVPRVPPPSTFGWAAAVLLTAGAAGLAAVAASPLLPGHAVHASGAVAAVLGSAPPAVPADVRPWAVAVPLALMALPLGAIAVGAACRRPTALTRWLTYAAAVFASALAFVTVQHHREQVELCVALERSFEQARASGLAGEAAFVTGPYAVVALIGASTAAALFVLAAFALHRRMWSRVVGTVMLGLPLAAAVAWLYRDALGLGGR